MTLNTHLKKTFAVVSSAICCMTGFSPVMPATAGDTPDSEPVRKALLVEDALPWKENTNSTVLSSMGVEFTKTTTAKFLNENLGNYSILIFANDQSFSTYENYSSFMNRVEDFAWLGGVVVFGACDSGWANGQLNTALPGGVTKTTRYEYKNYIVDADHPIVKNSGLTDTDLYSNYCSHVCFNESTLPAGSNVILRDTTKKEPTLVEYPIGDGAVIASGLTWEHNYGHYKDNSGTYKAFARKALDDMFEYALDLSSGEVDMTPPVALSVSGDKKMNCNGGKGDLTAKAKNISEVAAVNLSLEVGDLPAGISLAGGDENPKTYTRLEPGQSFSASWTFKTTLKTAKKVQVPVKLSYSTVTGVKATKTVYKTFDVVQDIEKKAILMIPGIAGTRLYANANMNSEDVIPEPFRSDSDYHQSYTSGRRFWAPAEADEHWGINNLLLYKKEVQTEAMMLNCDESGNSIANLRTEYLDEGGQNGAADTYTKLVNKLKADFGDEYTVEFFPYDWRNSITDAAQQLEDYINDNGFTNVTLVCHSMGGLVGSTYLTSAANREKVDKFITLGTPYLGAPKALYVFETGGLMDWPASQVMDEPLKAIANNARSVYELLPTANYFNLNGTTYVVKRDDGGWGHFDTKTDLNYSDTKDLIENRDWYKTANGGKKSFVTWAENATAALFNGDQHITELVDSYYIVGEKKKTITKVEELFDTNGNFDECSDTDKPKAGDGTVPLISATIGGTTPNAKTYYISETHTGLVSNDNTLALVTNIIKDDPNNYNHKKIKNGSERAGGRPMMFAPGAQVMALDDDDEEEESDISLKIRVDSDVADLAMIEDDGTEWAHISQDEYLNEKEDEAEFDLIGKNYNIKLGFFDDNLYNAKMIGNGDGKMDYTFSVFDLDDEIRRVIFFDVEIKEGMLLYSKTDREGVITLDVDEDGDGEIDYQIEPDYDLYGDDIERFDNGEYNKNENQYSESNVIAAEGMELHAGTLNVEKTISCEGVCEWNCGDIHAELRNINELYINHQLVESEMTADYAAASAGIDAVFEGAENVLPEDAVSFGSMDMIYYTDQNVTDFITDNTIAVYVGSINSDENTLFYSAAGDITLSASDISFDGVIYAPNGTVTLSAETINFHGTIVAKNVVIRGGTVNMD